MLRDYQEAAVEATFAYFDEALACKKERANPLIAMPTGTGKSWIIARLMQLMFQAMPTARVLMLTHVKKLIEQNFEKLVTLWPTAPAGIYSAGLKRREFMQRITYAGIASIINIVDQLDPINVVVIDEAHLVSHKSETMYRWLLDQLYKKNPRMKVIGLSATCYRMGLGMLTEGGIFTDVAFDMTTVKAFNWLVAQGYLAPLHAIKTHYELNVDDVRIVGGEFVQKELQAAVDKPDINRAVCREICEVAAERNRWKIFASGVEHAEHISYILNSSGIPTVAVHSKLDDEEHDRRFNAFKYGEVRCAVSMDEMTTGVDIPEIDFIGMLRHTRSTAKWVQMLGRGTRPCPEAEKIDCLVADFTNNSRDLGPINDPVLPRPPRERKGRGGGSMPAAPVRQCPVETCRSWVHASLGTCPYCGHFFATPKRLNFESSGVAVMKTEEEDAVVEDFTVKTITCHVHQKRGKPTSMQVSYHCHTTGGMPRLFREYICLEHDGPARARATAWWRERCPHIDPPDSVQRAVDLQKQLRIPKRISVWVNKKWPEITEYAY